jgi:oligopeptide transport system ATP-binding protein
MLLDVNRLRVRFETGEDTVTAVRDVSFSLTEGETLGIVGESGSGKSQTVMAIMGLLADNGRVDGSARFRGEELVGLPQRLLRRVRGNSISMIFQDPMTSLNPHLRIATQMTEVLAYHRGMGSRRAMDAAVAMLEAVHIPDAGRRIRYYPHEFSGGMRQRVMIAMALLCEPEILIADEPTTALDVTVQAEILDLIRDLRHRFGTSVLMITHDLGVVAGTCDRVIVMRQGEIVESGDAADIFARPQHDYTRALLNAVPRLDTPPLIQSGR